MGRKRTKLIQFKYPVADTCRLYLAKFEGLGETFIKIGVTKHSVEERFSKTSFYALIEHQDLMQGDEITMRGWESKILSDPNFYKHKYKPKHHFEGFSECFKPEIEMDLISITIENMDGQERVRRLFERMKRERELNINIADVELIACILNENTFAEHVLEMLRLEWFSDEISKIILGGILKKYYIDSEIIKYEEIEYPEYNEKFRLAMDKIRSYNVTDEIKIEQLKRIKEMYIKELISKINEEYGLGNLGNCEGFLSSYMRMRSPGFQNNIFDYCCNIDNDETSYDFRIDRGSFLNNKSEYYGF